MRLSGSVPLVVSLLAAALALGAGACQPAAGSSQRGPAKEPQGEPIAVVGGTKITVEQLQKRLDEQSPFVRVRYQDPEKKKEFLDSQVRFEVLAAEAFARGLDQDPEVLEATKKIIVQKLTREEFDSRVKLADVTDADMQKYFEEHKADYQKPEMARASDIVVAFGSDKAKAKKTAEEAQKKAADKAKLEDRNVFKDLAAQYSTDEATKRAGGDLRYLTRAEAEDKLGKAGADWLFGGETINEVSGVVEGKDAFHVLKRTGKRKEIVRTYEQVKNQIKNVVFREKRTEAFNKYVDELKQKHNVKVYEDKLDKLKVNAQLPPNVDPMRGHADPHAALNDDEKGERGEKEDVEVEPSGSGAPNAPSGPPAPAPPAPPSPPPPG
jgi:peptidyl-prolyl cis-trans isomerase C